MPKLPQEFTDRMKQQLGAQYDDFMASFADESYAGLRVNTGKITVRDFLARTPFALAPVPWTDNGFYYRTDDAVTKHPDYFAGLYYVQEPSAMLPASLLPVEPGDLVLDLCAAPGGKATELAAKLRGTGLLVANDASASRAKALVKNLAVWGAPNCCITGETPRRLLQQFGCCFDKILVDAPCSGEGMFRRDSALIGAWQEKGPEAYAPVQIEILDCAVQMLKPGGTLSYSTCTFSLEENEAVVAEILRRYPALELAEPVLPDSGDCSLSADSGHRPFPEGFAYGEAPYEKCIRIWPHRVKGEGHFCALIKKRADKAEVYAGEQANLKDGCNIAEQMNRKDGCRNIPEQMKQKNDSRNLPQPVDDFLALLPREIWVDKRYKQIGEQCLLLPPYRLPKGLRYLRTGLLLGTLKRGRFEPSQALAMLLRADTFPQVLDLHAQDERVIRYLKGETLELSAQEDAQMQERQSAWVLVCAGGFGLGWGKYVNGSIRNKYYPGWRLQ